MATAWSQVAGALVLVVLVLGAAEAQVLPTPCCRWACCDGRRECCDPGYVADPAAATSPSAAAVSAPLPGGAAGGGSATAGRKVGAGN
ncbi:hypothetical protein ACP70R_026770 [Stipagrostis hirtigluma subsp. patula]